MSQIVKREEQINTIKALFTSPGVLAQIRNAAPKHLTPERITRIAMTSVQMKPQLAACTTKSLLGSVLTCTQLGLEPDSVSGKAYLIPYGDVCTLIVGYRGLMELARRSGEIQALEARVAYEGDILNFEYGAHPKLVHKPKLDHSENIVAVYAVATMRNGSTSFEVMSKKEVDVIRARSKAGKAGPWVTDYPEMARKTVMRRLCKYLPSSPELQRAIILDESADTGIPQDLTPMDVEVTRVSDEKKPRDRKAKPKSLEDITPEEPSQPEVPPTEPPTEPVNEQAPEGDLPPDDTPAAREDMLKAIRNRYMKLTKTKRDTALKVAELGNWDELGVDMTLETLQSVWDAMLSA